MMEFQALSGSWENTFFFKLRGLPRALEITPAYSGGFEGLWPFALGGVHPPGCTLQPLLLPVELNGTLLPHP